MKKGLCVVLSALMLVMSFSACSKKGNDATDAETKVDENGTTYVEVTDKNGEPVTGDDGKVVTSVVTDKKSDDKDSSDEKDTTSDKKSDSKTEKTESTSLELNSKVIENVTDVDSDSLDMFADKEDLYEEGTTIKKTTLFEDKVKKVLETGKFTIDMNVTSNDTEMPMKLAFDKDKMYASFNMNGMEAGIIYMDDTAYLLFPNLFNGVKAYMEYPDADESMGEVFDSFNQVSDNNGKYKGSSKVKVDNKTYTCEEYESDDGTVFKYYFEGKDWKRYECISSDDEIMIYEINSFSGKVDSDLFSLKGYTKIDEEALSALGGLSS